MTDLTKYVEHVKNTTISQSRPFAAKAAEFFDELHKSPELELSRKALIIGAVGVTIGGGALVSSAALSSVVAVTGYAMLGCAAFGGKAAKLGEYIANLFAKKSVINSSDKIINSFASSLSSLQEQLSPIELAKVADYSQKEILKQFENDLSSIEKSGILLGDKEKQAVIENTTHRMNETFVVPRISAKDFSPSP